MADTNSLTQEALEILGRAQPSEQTTSALMDFLTRLPMTLMELAQLSIWVLGSLALVTWLIKKFVLDNIGMFIAFPGVVKWVLAFLGALVTAVFWMPILLPIILGFVGGD